MNKKPSFPVFATAFFLLLFLGGIIFVSGETQTAREQQKTASGSQKARAASDWQQTLASITNNGAPEEAPQEPVPVSTITDSNEPLTKTDVVSRKLFGAYVELQKNDALTPENQEKLIQNILSEIQTNPGTVTAHYTAEDIKTSSDTSRDALLAYRTALTAIIVKNSFTGMGSELAPLQRGAQAPDSASMKKASSAYGAIAKALLLVTVPEKLASVHLALINGFSALSGSTDTLATFSTDPIGALSAVSQYQAAAASIAASLSVEI